MVLTRATNQPGPDGLLGTADDIHEHLNQTSPFVDQNQTYTSDPSHQVFLRAYEFNAAGDPVATGRLITNRDLGADGEFGTADDVELGGMSTWGVVKAQARDLSGIELSDYDAVNVPMVRVDPLRQLHSWRERLRPADRRSRPRRHCPDSRRHTDGRQPGGSDQPARCRRPAHRQNVPGRHCAFRQPVHSRSGTPLAADADAGIGDDLDPATYDDELLAEHFMAGDGRVNENIGLTAVHHVFHAEHNRLVEHTKAVIINDATQLLASGATQAEAIAFINEWLVVDVATVPTTAGEIAALQWDGERLFQAAKFGTEMQYQHLVFEEFARKIQPQVDVFLAPAGFDTTINAAIVAEFAHTVYRFGHSMLLDQIDRLSPDFVSSEIGLIDAFLNPLEFDQNDTLTAEEAAGAIVRGTTRQIGNAIDEFKTEALRNNLLGLPLDLATINLARGRDTGIPSLNDARAQFYR